MASRLHPWPRTAQQVRALSWIDRNDPGQVDVFCDLWIKAVAAGDVGPDHPPPFNSPGSLWQAWKHQPAVADEHHAAADALASKHGFVAAEGGGHRARFWFTRV